MNPRISCAVLAFAAVLLGRGAAPLPAKMADWRDTQGNIFRAEPSEALGPLAVFRNAKGGANLVPFHVLSPGDCVRFYEEVKDAPARSDDWKDAGAHLSAEVFRFSQRVAEDRLVDVDLSGRREPRFYIVFYGSNDESKAWETVDRLLPLYPKLRDAFPGDVELLFFGVKHSMFEHANMAVSKNMPWLVARHRDQSRMNLLRRLAPTDGAGIMVFTRLGTPLFNSSLANFDEITRPIGDLAVLLETIGPQNPKSWKDRVHYLRAVQPVIHAHSRCDPVLVGDPLVADGLRQRQVFQIDATIDVTADGGIANVTIVPDAANLPAAMEKPLATALQRSAVFVPAVENGRFVDGVYRYHIEVPR